MPMYEVKMTVMTNMTPREFDDYMNKCLDELICKRGQSTGSLKIEKARCIQGEE